MFEVLRIMVVVKKINKGEQLEVVFWKRVAVG
jgi:hypothetical protein